MAMKLYIIESCCADLAKNNDNLALSHSTGQVSNPSLARWPLFKTARQQKEMVHTTHGIPWFTKFELSMELRFELNWDPWNSFFEHPDQDVWL